MPTAQRLCITFLILLSSACFGQIASVTSLFTAGGFLDVCGNPASHLSTAQTETIKNGPPSELADRIVKGMADRTAELAMCVAYVAGLEQGWKEGHEHGVLAAQFPNGWPKDETKALAALPVKQLEAGQAAMTIDVPCIPDYVTLGQQVDIIVKYIREQEKKGNAFISVSLTRRVMWLAYQEAFPCVQTPK